MENHMNFEASWKQQAKDGLTRRTKRAFGVFRSIYYKFDDSRLVTHFFAYETEQTVGNCKLRVEQGKAEGFLHTRPLTI